MSKGNLLDLIKTAPTDISKADLLEMAKQIASGMLYLSTAHMVHRDLALRSIALLFFATYQADILVTSSGSQRYVAKVSDFGLSRIVTNSTYYKSQGMIRICDDFNAGSAIPYKWSAPESLNYGKFDSKSGRLSLYIRLSKTQSQLFLLHCN